MTIQLEKEFVKYSNIAKVLPKKPSDNDMLFLYGFYKQATIGDCNIEQPAFNVFKLKEYKKWEAWNSHEGIDTKTAMRQYIEKVKQLLT